MPERSQKQEDKANSVCHELQTIQLMNEHAMKSHTNRINRGVHGASWGKVVQNPHLQRPVESVKVPEFEMDSCHLLQDHQEKTPAC